MRVLVVYESMYGNTHTVAERIGGGLVCAAGITPELVRVGVVTPERVRDADLVVVGGPTHVHGISTSFSRKQAVTDETLAKEAEKGHDLEVDPDAEGPGLRDWFSEMGAPRPTFAAAFDTRFNGPGALTGRASRGIARKLRHHGFHVVADPESFLVDQETHLVDGEAERAERWGHDLLAAVAGRAEATRREPPGEDPLEPLDATVESGGRYDPR